MKKVEALYRFSGTISGYCELRLEVCGVVVNWPPSVKAKARPLATSVKPPPTGAMVALGVVAQSRVEISASSRSV